MAWRDTDLQIEGPVVGELQKLFIQTWEKQNGKPLAAERLFSRAQRRRAKKLCAPSAARPTIPYSLIYLTLISAIGNAERQVYLTIAYFVPDPQLLNALTDAAGARGRCEADIAEPFRLRGRISRRALALFQPARGGVKIYERAGALLHSKTAVIDGVWSTVGSTNLDWRSFLDNDEINAVILGRDFGGQMLAMFATDIEASQAIDLESWESRPFSMRFKEWMARVWGRLL